jgi:cob(I)alamin adenosyltransferase
MEGLMKIYTKTGDKGQTSLVGGKRVAKTHVRLEAYGCMDELNSHLGLCLSAFAAEKPLPELKTIAERLRRLQHRIFNVGSLLACEDAALAAQLPSLQEEDLKSMEAWIDEEDRCLAPLKNFILPGGSVPAAHLHVARTVARRAERRIAQLEDSSQHPLILPFVNRLSDYLFILARRCNQLLGHADVLWKKDL